MRRRHPPRTPWPPPRGGALNDFASLDEALERYQGRGPFAQVDPEVLGDYVRDAFRPTTEGVTLKTPGEVEARVFEGVDVTVFGQLGAVTCPVTVVGSGDGAPPARAAPLVAAALRKGRFHSWSDRTHFGPFEDPARAAGEIIAALA
ncbi:MAG: hypothetical protein R2695_08090 [Acidimicrobiales bacterium]